MVQEPGYIPVWDKMSGLVKDNALGRISGNTLGCSRSQAVFQTWSKVILWAGSFSFGAEFQARPKVIPTTSEQCVKMISRD